MKDYIEIIIDKISKGDNFCIDFYEIDIIRDGIIRKSMCQKGNNRLATFQRGDRKGHLVTSLDFSTEAITILDDFGATAGMDTGFDMYLLDPWKIESDKDEKYVISYNIFDNGIDRFVVEGVKDVSGISLLIFMTNGNIIRLQEGQSNQSESNR